MDMHGRGPLIGAWFDQRNDENNIFAQLFSAQGYRFGENFKVNDAAGTAEAYAPDVAMDGRGHFYIAWTDNRNGNDDIYMQMYKASGDPIGENIRVNKDNSAESQIRPAVAAGKEGHVIVCWEDSRLGVDKRLIYAQYFGPDGEPRGENFIVDTDTTHGQLYPDVAMNAGGAYIITWTEHSGGNRNDVFFRRFNHMGMPWGNVRQVSNCSDLNGTSQHPAVSYLDNYDFAIFWEFVDSVGNIFVHGHLYDNDDFDKVGDLVKFEETLGYSMHTKPALGTSSYLRHVLTWQGNKSGELDILSATFTSWSTEPQDISVVNDQPGMQIYPTTTADYRNNYLYAWHDDRNGNFDIYTCREGLNYCNEMVFSGGYDGKVVISWEPPYGYGDQISYRIYRATDAFATPELITTVDPEQRSFPEMMYDYIDTDVENGQNYYYEVVPVIDDAPRYPFLMGPAVPSAMGHFLNSSWMQTAPDIDGHIDPQEWQDATALEIQSKSALHPITLYVKNDRRILYLALDDKNNKFLDDRDYFALSFDENNNQIWDSPNGILEGTVHFDQDSHTLTTYRGTWPQSIGIHSMTPMNGIDKAMSMQSGNLQYEVAISLITAPLLAQPGDIIGVRFFNSDPENYYQEHYNHASQWPAGALWETPRTLGKLQLAVEPVTPHYNWPMAGGGANGQNAAIHETKLMPLFESYQDHDIQKSKRLTVRENTMVISQYTNHNSENRFICYDLENNTQLWSWDVPNSETTSVYTAAISDSLVFCRGRDNDSLYALDRYSGKQVWQSYIGKKSGDPILDGNRLYIAGDTLYAIDQTSGEKIWRFDNPNYLTIHTPTVGENCVYLANRVEMFCLDKQNGTLNWQKTNTGGQSQSLVDQHRLYSFDDENIIARDKSDGSILWSYPVPGAELAQTNTSCMTLMNDVLSVPLDNEDGKARLLSLNARNGAQLWEHEFDTTGVYIPTVANGVVYIVQRGRLGNAGYNSKFWALRLSNGEPLFFDASLRFTDQPVVANHQLFVPSKNYIRAFSMQPTAVDQSIASEGPESFQLLQNYPNPFNPRTTIRYRLERPGKVKLSIYSLLGKEIKTLINRYQSSGSYDKQWDATDRYGQPLPSGLYFVRLQSNSQVQSRKILLVR